MDEPNDGLAMWKCHKIVKAAKISREIEPAQPGSGVSVFMIDAFDIERCMYIDRKVFARGYPKVGDYFVIYAPDDDHPGGYFSWSPAKAFEEGYTRQ